MGTLWQHTDQNTGLSEGPKSCELSRETQLRPPDGLSHAALTHRHYYANEHAKSNIKFILLKLLFSLLFFMLKAFKTYKNTASVA